MENNRDLRKIRLRNLLLSFVVFVFCMAALLIPMKNKVQEAYSFDSAAGIDVAAVREAYAAGNANKDLYDLALALCRQAYIEGEAFDPAELCECGRELYRRAKAGTLDLEEIGDPADTTQMINLLKDYGVTASNS